MAEIFAAAWALTCAGPRGSCPEANDLWAVFICLADGTGFLTDGGAAPSLFIPRPVHRGASGEATVGRRPPCLAACCSPERHAEGMDRLSCGAVLAAVCVVPWGCLLFFSARCRTCSFAACLPLSWGVSVAFGAGRAHGSTGLSDPNDPAPVLTFSGPGLGRTIPEPRSAVACSKTASRVLIRSDPVPRFSPVEGASDGVPELFCAGNFSFFRPCFLPFSRRSTPRAPRRKPPIAVSSSVSPPNSSR